MRHFSWLILLITLVSFGCRHRAVPIAAESPVESGRSAAPTQELDASTRSEALARFATGISYELNDQSDQALEQFYQASMADPSNEILAMELARRYAQTRDFNKAIAVLSRSASRPNASGLLFANLAKTYRVTGKTNLAANASRSAIKKSPNQISGYQTLTEILLETGQTNEAIKLLNGAARLTNSDALFLVHLNDLYTKVAGSQGTNGTVLRERGIELLRRAAALEPGNPNTRQRLADAFALAGETKPAAELYLGLLTEFSDIPLMRDGMREKLANLYLKSSDRAKAAEQLEAVVRDSPTRYPEAWYYLGNLAYEAKNYEKAADYFQRALVINPDLEQAYYDWAGMQISIDQPGEGLKTLEKARARFPENFTLEFFAGLAHSRMKNFSEALKHFTSAEIIGNASGRERLNHFFYFQVGATHERNKDFAQAETYFEKALELSPDFADALNYLGFMWADRGEKLVKAKEYIERAVKLEPTNAAFLDSLGWVLFKLDEPAPALKYLLQAVEHSEEPDPTVLDHLGDVYLALKQTDKAREAWRKSLELQASEDVEKKLQANPETN